jgi:hypothetical protein
MLKYKKYNLQFPLYHSPAIEAFTDWLINDRLIHKNLIKDQIKKD